MLDYKARESLDSWLSTYPYSLFMYDASWNIFEKRLFAMIASWYVVDF